MILAYKKIGQTPLDVVKDLRKNNSLTLSYAGRLDPMAEGLLLILEGDENKKRREYEHFDKEYIFEAIIGIKTDSYDLLGIPTLGKVISATDEEIKSFIEKNTGQVTQRYPAYSSFKIEGKPLYWWTRKNKKVIIPKREITVKEFEFVSRRKINSSSLKAEIDKRLDLVNGDFRQKEIKKEWEKFFAKNQKAFFEVFEFRIVCSGGTYVRSIVNDMGKDFKTNAVTFSIKRTRIGDLSLPKGKTGHAFKYYDINK